MLKFPADEGEVFCWGWNKYGQVGISLLYYYDFSQVRWGKNLGVI